MKINFITTRNSTKGSVCNTNSTWLPLALFTLKNTTKEIINNTVYVNDPNIKYEHRQYMGWFSSPDLKGAIRTNIEESLMITYVKDLKDTGYYRAISNFVLNSRFFLLGTQKYSYSRNWVTYKADSGLFYTINNNSTQKTIPLCFVVKNDIRYIIGLAIIQKLENEFPDWIPELIPIINKHLQIDISSGLALWINPEYFRQTLPQKIKRLKDLFITYSASMGIPIVWKKDTLEKELLVQTPLQPVKTIKELNQLKANILHCL